MISWLAVNAPVEGLKDNFVDVTFWGKLPLLLVTQVGYTVAFVVVSSVIAVFVAFPTVKLDAVPVSPVPAPLNEVEVKAPVLGLYWSLVELVYSVVRLPVV